LNERNLVGANDVDDQSLRQQALHEPTGLEQACAVGRRLGRRDVPASEDVKHHEECGVVEDRRAGADEDDEPSQLPDIPGFGLLDLFRVNLVRRDRGLTDVIQQIIGE